MKKAKFMLMAIAVFAVIGGALAFKATKFNGTAWLCTTTDIFGPKVCTQPGYEITINLGFVSTVYNSTHTPGTCPNTAVAETIYCTRSVETSITANPGE